MNAWAHARDQWTLIVSFGSSEWQKAYQKIDENDEIDSLSL